MKNAQEVTNLVTKLKDQGKVLSNVAWQAALACVGWAYVFGARGQYCTPANRRARYSAEHPTIKTACKNYNGSGSAGCSGCKWYPKDQLTRIFDCRGFTYWILKQVFGWELVGAGCTSQWNNEKNWKQKGLVTDGIPPDVIVCLFYKDKNNAKVMAHTGFYYNGETVECSSGVQHKTKLDKKWTHWAVPACVGEKVKDPEPVADPAKDQLPTLRRGSKGTYVTKLQTLLKQRGYNLGSAGIDGDYGPATEAAVKQFQRDWGLTVDGVTGPKTWAMLESTPAKKVTFTVTVKGLTKEQAEKICKEYKNASMKEE